MVIGDADPHLGVDLGLVRRVRCGQSGGDVLQAGDKGLDVLGGEPGGGCLAEEGFEPAPTVLRWRDRVLAEGDAGLHDRSLRPHRSPNRTRRSLRRRVIRLRRKHRWGADHIAFEVGLAASIVQNILDQAGVGCLDRGDRVLDREPVRRYQREHPVELIHVDVKKLAEIPDRGGWRLHGRG